MRLICNSAHHVIVKMAEEREPPPFEDEDSQKDEDDLFADASQGQTPTEEKQEEPNETTRVPVKPDMDSLFDDDDGDEVKLDSDEDEVKSNPVATQEIVTEPVPEVTSKAAEISLDDDEVDEDEARDEPTEMPKLSVTQTVTSSSKASTATKTTREESEDDQYTINIKITEAQKMGDGMGAYISYRVVTKTSIPQFRKPDLMVMRRFSDFLGLHEKLSGKYVCKGKLVPPAPEKSVIGMTKVKISKEDSGSSDFVERRRVSLERYLNRTAAQPHLRKDPDFKDFLERDGELPKATSTSALSGAGVMRLFHKVGDSLDKIAFKMDEADEWFEEKQLQIENLDQQLRKLHSSMEALVNHRRDLSFSTASFAKSAAMLGNAEEHTALSRAMSQLADTEERIDQIQREQADNDFFVMAELLREYISMLGAVKEIFYERVKAYKNWKESEQTLTKKRENKAKLELSNKTDKLPMAKAEIREWENKVEKDKEEFENISEVIRKEVARFDADRVEDFKANIIRYLEHLMESQQRIIKCWEAFLPEAKAVA